MVQPALCSSPARAKGRFCFFRDRLPSASCGTRRPAYTGVRNHGPLILASLFPLSFLRTPFMRQKTDRRNFLRDGSLVTAGLLASTAGPEANAADPPPQHDRVADMAFPRDHPGRGGPVGSPTDRGKLVPGLRSAT